jgi:hypothetical protein
MARQDAFLAKVPGGLMVGKDVVFPAAPGSNTLAIANGACFRFFTRPVQIDRRADGP